GLSAVRAGCPGSGQCGPRRPGPDPAVLLGPRRPAGATGRLGPVSAVDRSSAAIRPDDFTATAAALTAQLRRLIVGQEGLLRDTVTTLLAGGHVLLEGVPGLGKTVLVRALGDALSLRFSRIQFTPDLMPADIV